jgi:4-hydroxybenzoate polyprenyltransferase
MAKTALIINALSLDAVAVSLLWQFIFCISFSQSPPTLAESVSLGLTVWLIYCADRLLDATRIDTRRQATFRHRFHRRYRHPMTIVWMLVMVADALVVCFGIDPPTQVLGIGLAAAVLVYGAGVHFAATPLKHIAKELQVGVLFAVGVSLVAWPHVVAETSNEVKMLITLALASLLFACNCIFVAACELEFDQAQGFDSLPHRWMHHDRNSIDRFLILSTGFLAITSLALVALQGIPATAGLAIAISFAFLSATGMFQSTWRRSSPITAGGFAADTALFLPPLLSLLWLP